VDVDVRALSGDEWQLKRDLRLTALKDSPDAFASSYAREAHRSETDWRTWPPGGAFFTAFLHGHDTVELEVARGNTPAMTAYLRCGFIVTQREPFTTGGTVLVRPVNQH
jgi:hypothetical protein